MEKIDRDRLAAMNFHYKFYPFDYFLSIQQELGLRNIEVWAGRPHFLLDEYNWEDTNAFRKKIEQRGLHIAVFSPECTIYNYGLCTWDPIAAEHSMRYFKNGIYACSELGAKTMVLNCFGGARDEKKECIYDRAVKRLSELAAVAEKQNIILAIETLRPEDSPVLNTLAELKTLLTDVGSKNVKACLDLTAAGLAGETMSTWFSVLGSQVHHIRFMDGRPQGRLVWGDGLRPLEDYIEVMHRNAYQGYISLYLNDSRYFDEPEKADRRNMAALSPFLKG
jgi:protein FrlC